MRGAGSELPGTPGRIGPVPVRGSDHTPVPPGPAALRPEMTRAAAWTRERASVTPARPVPA